MKISDITGSASAADNLTSVYTFAMGIIAGSFITFGLDVVDRSNDLAGGPLKIYLPILTAMMGGGIGLLVSRVGDRIGDRRKRKRAFLAVLHNLQDLKAALSVFLHGIPTERDAEGNAISTPETDLLIIVHAERVRVSADRPLSFSDAIDDPEELVMATSVRDLFSHMLQFFRAPPAHELSDYGAVAAEAERFRNKRILDSIQFEIENLEQAVDFYDRRLFQLT